MTPESDDQQEVDIEAAFDEGTPIDEALNRGVREAVLLHRRLGLPMAVWRDNRVVWVDPDDPDDGSASPVTCGTTSAMPDRLTVSNKRLPRSENDEKGELTMTKTLHGIVRGKTIELGEDPGIPEGQEVEIMIKAIPSSSSWGEGLRRCAGALATEWSPDDDRILEEIYRDRMRDPREDVVE